MKPDMVIMKGGRMMLLRSGDLIVLDENITLPDGTKVMTDGTIILMNGITFNLVEGEGMIMDAPMAAVNHAEG